jgi:hypothetical protein
MIFYAREGLFLMKGIFDEKPGDNPFKIMN